ncbi:MAG: hypothetical protein AAF430_24575 [Myxococcota bacterium]
MRPPLRRQVAAWGSALALLLPFVASADWTEFEDQPFLDPGGAEVDGLASAEPIPTGGADFFDRFGGGPVLVRGHLDAGDIDAYAVSLTSGDLLLATLFDANSGAFLDPVLGVFSGGALPALSLDDDGGPGFGNQLGHLAGGTGVFELGVSGFGDAAFDGTHDEALQALAPYELVLSVARDGALPLEHDLTGADNDVAARANLLAGNGGLVRATLAANDVDYYAIELEEGDRLFASVYDLRDSGFDFGAGERPDPVVGLWDPNGVAPSSSADDDAARALLPARTFTVPPGGGGRWTVAVSGFGDTAFDGTHDEGPFDYVFSLVRDRACPSIPALVSGISASTANSYVLATLEGGDHYYTDRTNPQSHVLVDVPEELECAEWIQTANNDKNVSTNPHLQFSLAQDATVYIGYDTRATAEPSWLAQDFTPTTMLVDIADPDPVQEFDVLRRDFAAGPVALGGNLAPGAGSNYIVIVKPLDTDDADQAYQLPSVIGTGFVSITVNGVVVIVATTAGQTAASLASALAAAINADATLQSQRIFALASGDTVVTTGTIDEVVLGFPVPGLTPFALALTALLLAAAAWSALRERPSRQS